MRTRYRKNRIRKSTKYFCITIAIVLIITCLGTLMESLLNENKGVKTKQIYFYSNKFNYDYQVKLIENKYIKQSEKTEKEFAYVTDLIDYTNLTLDYQYQAQKESDLTYEYEIIGKMQAVYTKDGEEQKILDEQETLLEKVIKTDHSNEIKIQEKLKLDLKEKNNLLNEFKQKMGMPISANYAVILKVRVRTTIEEKEVIAEYNPTIMLDLAEKTTKISGENNKEDTQYISKEEKQTDQSPFIIIINILGIVIAIYLLIFVAKAKVTNRVKNEYRQELNRILKLCQDKIVQVKTRPESNSENTVDVKDFGEIVKLSEELFKPILYYFNQEKEEAWFNVISNQVTYRYILRK